MANPLLPPSHTINISLGQIKLPRVFWRSMCKHVEGGGLSSIYSERDYMPLACSFPAGQNQRPRWICPKPDYTPRKWRGTCPLPLQQFQFRTGGVCQTLHFWKFNRCLHPKQQLWLETMQAAGLVTNDIFIRCWKKGHCWHNDLQWPSTAPPLLLPELQRYMGISRTRRRGYRMTSRIAVANVDCEFLKTHFFQWSLIARG